MVWWLHSAVNSNRGTDHFWNVAKCHERCNPLLKVIALGRVENRNKKMEKLDWLRSNRMRP